jgi:hypothetical protein
MFSYAVWSGSGREGWSWVAKRQGRCFAAGVTAVQAVAIATALIACIDCADALESGVESPSIGHKLN